MRGTLYIVAAPSGAGKSSIVNATLARDAQIALSISFTSRAMRPGEENGKHYHFVSAAAFEEMIAAGRVVESAVTTQLADGMACRVADQAALDILAPHLDHVVQVSDAEVAAAMHALYTDTHNAAEGAGAAALAAALQEKERLAGQAVGAALTGGNVDAAVFARVLGGASC